MTKTALSPVMAARARLDATRARVHAAGEAVRVVGRWTPEMSAAAGAVATALLPAPTHLGEDLWHGGFLAVGGLAATAYLQGEFAGAMRARRKLANELVQIGLTDQFGGAPRIGELKPLPFGIATGYTVDIRMPRRHYAGGWERNRPLLETALGAQIRLSQIPPPKRAAVRGAIRAGQASERWAEPRWNSRVAKRDASRPARYTAKPVAGGEVEFELDEAYQVRPPKVRPPEPSPRGGVRLTVVRSDVLSRPNSTPCPLLERDGTGQIRARKFLDEKHPLGMDERGRIVWLDWSRTVSLLVAGATGSGKSVATHAIIAAAVLDPDCDIITIDGKTGVELGTYDPIVARPMALDLDDALESLKWLEEEMEARYRLLKDKGLKKADSRTVKPLFVVIEEITAYTGTKGTRAEWCEVLMRLLVRIRAANMRIMLTIQRPSATGLPTDIRDNIEARLCFRVSNDTTSDMALTEGWAAMGYSAGDIPRTSNYKGVAWLWADEDYPLRVKTWYSGDDLWGKIVARGCELRGLPTPSRIVKPKSMKYEYDFAENFAALADAVDDAFEANIAEPVDEAFDPDTAEFVVLTQMEADASPPPVDLAKSRPPAVSLTKTPTGGGTPGGTVIDLHDLRRDLRRRNRRSRRSRNRAAGFHSRPAEKEEQPTP
jgi:DNA segregation ATPase FtsK/SpoIIIE, S-DNA-T family